MRRKTTDRTEKRRRVAGMRELQVADKLSGRHTRLASPPVVPPTESGAQIRIHSTAWRYTRGHGNRIPPIPRFMRIAHERSAAQGRRLAYRCGGAGLFRAGVAPGSCLAAG